MMDRFLLTTISIYVNKMDSILYYAVHNNNKIESYVNDTNVGHNTSMLPTSNPDINLLLL